MVVCCVECGTLSRGQPRGVAILALFIVSLSTTLSIVIQKRGTEQKVQSWEKGGFSGIEKNSGSPAGQLRFAGTWSPNTHTHAHFKRVKSGWGKSEKMKIKFVILLLVWWKGGGRLGVGNNLFMVWLWVEHTMWWFEQHKLVLCCSQLLDNNFEIFFPFLYLARRNGLSHNRKAMDLNILLANWVFWMGKFCSFLSRICWIPFVLQRKMKRGLDFQLTILTSLYETNFCILFGKKKCFPSRISIFINRVILSSLPFSLTIQIRS